MGNESTKKKLLVNDDGVPKKKKFSFSRSISNISQDSLKRTKSYDISEADLKEIRATYNNEHTNRPNIIVGGPYYVTFYSQR